MTKANGKRSRINWSVFLLGFGAGVFITALVAGAAFFLFDRPPPPPPTWIAELKDPANDPMDARGEPASTIPAYLDIVSAEIVAGDRGVLDEEGRSSGEAAEGEEEVRVAVVHIKMADSVPPPPEQDQIFTLGLAIDADGDPANNDTITPNTMDSDTTIAITCDPSQGRCIEGIAAFDGDNWSLTFKDISWSIEEDTVKMAFLLDFLPGEIEEARWRVFSSVLNANDPEATTSDVVPESADSPVTLSPLR
jgi:hypothetical protein